MGAISEFLKKHLDEVQSRLASVGGELAGKGDSKLKKETFRRIEDFYLVLGFGL
ncbi:MAG: hypothetical protein HY717_11990 [Planctomycetes bacterium]|nr:hypothetical protein [Planctomycetota bacterium]